MSALAFDPHKALAEIENETGLRANWAKRANPGTTRPNPSPTLAPLAPLALSPSPNAKIELRAGGGDPAAWFAALTALDANRAPAGIGPDWWRTVLAHALWIARNHAEAAAALGWSASDLFGLADYPGEGGLADRLEGARRLAFTSSVAHWRGEEIEGWLWRRTLTAKPALWESSQQCGDCRDDVEGRA